MMSELSEFSDLLKPDGAVALVIKQALAPVNEDDPVIFPPSYPITTFKGRVHTVRDGDYRVSVELPANSKQEKEKADKNSDQVPGYNIDRFSDGTNSCDIDSPQSQANRIEPMFKDLAYRALVPQIEIKVNDETGRKVNLLDVGHRAGDAVVRMSSLADKFHDAFLEVGLGDHFTLATLAPTSLLFGVWDSRSTQEKIQRIIKMAIRASNVRERTRSAQFTPAIDYVEANAVPADLDSGEGDSNPLSAEGMKHALAIQKAGGIMLTDASELTRTVNLNLVALRTLKGSDDSKTEALQRYMLGLALVAATATPDLNLREGCNLRFKDESDTYKLIPRRGDVKAVTFNSGKIKTFAEESARAFFRLAEIPFDGKDHPDAIFERGVAAEFLAYAKKEDRDKIRRLGPITAATLKQFREIGADPFKVIREAVKVAKAALGKGAKKGMPVRNLEALLPLAEALKEVSENLSLPEDAKTLASELAEIVQEHSDSHAAIKTIETKLKAFKSQGKGAGADAPVTVRPEDE